MDGHPRQNPAYRPATRKSPARRGASSFQDARDYGDRRGRSNREVLTHPSPPTGRAAGSTRTTRADRHGAECTTVEPQTSVSHAGPLARRMGPRRRTAPGRDATAAPRVAEQLDLVLRREGGQPLDIRRSARLRRQRELGCGLTGFGDERVEARWHVDVQGPRRTGGRHALRMGHVHGRRQRLARPEHHRAAGEIDGQLPLEHDLRLGRPAVDVKRRPLAGWLEELDDAEAAIRLRAADVNNHQVAVEPVRPGPLESVRARFEP